jgi:serine/threonine protein kinase
MGIIMFEMFTGRLPYDAKTPATVMNAHVEGSLFKPSAVAEVHPALERVILKAVARNPLDRYQSIADLIGDLETMEDTPYAATLIVPRPVLDSQPKTPVAKPELQQSAKPWERVRRFFQK